MSRHLEELRSAPALTIHQPWADLIIEGRKSIELRSWTTSYRGAVWIHAGQKNDVAGEIYNVDRKCGFRGGIIGFAWVEAMVPLTPDRWEQWLDQHLATGPFVPGLFGWLLSNPCRLIEPLPIRGKLKLFPLPTDTREVLLQRVLNSGRGEVLHSTD